MKDGIWHIENGKNPFDKHKIPHFANCHTGSYAYIKALAGNFYGMGETKAYRAINLDVEMITAENILEKAEISVIE